MERQQTIIIHRLATNQTETRTFEGREYYVIPVVAVQEQVLNGQLAPAEELSKYIDSWNDSPVPVGHPVVNGQKVSARSPEILESQVVGRFYYPQWTANKQLKGQIWVDKAKIESLSVLNADIAAAKEKIEKGEPMNVSTAYFSDIELTSGVFNNVNYNGVQRNIRPDHLALLPNQLGACSLTDGCGTMVVNQLEGGESLSGAGEGKEEADQGDAVQDNPETLKENAKKALNVLKKFLGFEVETSTGDPDKGQEIQANMSYSKIREQARSLLREKLGEQYDVWVMDVDTENWLIYEQEEKNGGDMKYFKQAFAIDASENVSLVGEPVEVVRKTIYEPVQPATNQEKEGDNDMADKKDEIITRIAAFECNAFKKDDLKAMSEESLEIIEAGLKANCSDGGEGEGEAQPGKPEPQANDKKDSTEAAPEPDQEAMKAMFKTFAEEAFGMSMDEVRANLAKVKSGEEAERGKLVEVLKANGFEEEELKGIQANLLQKMVDNLKPANYLGQGGPRIQGLQGNEDYPLAPDFTRNEKKDGDK